MAAHDRRPHAESKDSSLSPSLQADMALIISNTKRRPRVVKEKSPSGYHSG